MSDVAGRRAVLNALASGDVGGLFGNLSRAALHGLALKLIELRRERVLEEEPDRLRSEHDRFLSFSSGSGPRLSLQWKGAPCVDWECECGCTYHGCEAEFMYHVRCPNCNRVYAVSSDVELVEVGEEEAKKVRKEKRGRIFPAANTGPSSGAEGRRRYLRERVDWLERRIEEMVSAREDMLSELRAS